MTERSHDPSGALFAPSMTSAFPAGLGLATGHVLRGLILHHAAYEGPVSTVYRATDKSTGQLLAIKEYLPRHLVARRADGTVRALNSACAHNFARGLQAFKDEARLFMSSHHPALVKVQQLLEQGGTAYVVMPWLAGATLQEWLAGLGTPPSEIWLRNMLRPLMQALEALHRKGGYHSGLSLHSIWLQFDNKAESYLSQHPQPVLMGCGSSVRSLQQADADFRARSGPSTFGPVEQLDGDVHVRMGAWTDAYGLCAVAYAALFGRPPPPSVARMARDELVSARKLGRSRYSATLLAAIDAGLVVKPQHRVQSMAALRLLMDEVVPTHSQLGGAAHVGVAAHVQAVVSLPMGLADELSPLPGPGLGGPWWVWSAGLGALLLALAVLGQLLQS